MQDDGCSSECGRCRSVVQGQNGECEICPCPGCSIQPPDYDGKGCKQCPYRFGDPYEVPPLGPCEGYAYDDD